MKRINVLLTLAAVIAVLGLFAACEQPETPVKRVTVTFVDPLNTVSPDPVTLDQGKTLGDKFPADPGNATVDGVVNYFYGWFDGYTEYDDETPIGASVTLRARWRQNPPQYIYVKFESIQDDGAGGTIAATAPFNDVKVIKGKRLSKSQLPATPRSKGWKFDQWYGDNALSVPYNFSAALNIDTPLYAKWNAAGTYTVTFDSGLGGSTVNPIIVFEDECIDEWGKAFPQKPTNSVPRTFFVAWLDNENREYDGRTVITRNVLLKAKWGLPPYIVNFDTDIAGAVTSPGDGYGDVDYAPKVRASWDNPDKKVIVNDVTYESPYNTNRWRILYRVQFKWPISFNTSFYTRYTIRARFYANKQGGPNPPDSAAFKPNKPAKGVGYNANGLLRGVNSPSDDGWGQVSWTKVANWDGQGADADTLLQRYNLDRKGGTINDTWAPLRGTTQPWPPYLLIQTSDNYIGHVEITQIVFHNGEKKYTMYTDEDGYATAEDGLKD